MKATRTILNVFVLVYVVFLTLLLTGLLNASTFFNLSTQAQVSDLYKILLAISAFVLLAKLIISNLSIAHKKHDLHRAKVKITDLKAELYDERQAYRSSQSTGTQAEEEETKAVKKSF